MALAVGSRLRLVISDPFELSQTLDVALAGIDSFAGGTDVERILVDLPFAVIWNGRTYHRLVIERRSSPGLIDELVLGLSVECNGYGSVAVPEDGAPWRRQVARWPWGYRRHLDRMNEGVCLPTPKYAPVIPRTSAARTRAHFQHGRQFDHLRRV